MQHNNHAFGRRGQDPNVRAFQNVEDPFAGDTVDVARRLVGATLRRIIPAGEPDAGELLTGRIVETEAYLPNVDPACHGYLGPTKRNAVMFGRPGSAYVYFIYGVHFCLNVVTEPAGAGGAVLIRAVEPLQGIDAMRRRRPPNTADAALARGPGNLCRAMSIDLRCDGADLRSGDLRVVFGSAAEQLPIAVTTRVGLSVAGSWPLRFYDPESKSVSRRPILVRGR